MRNRMLYLMGLAWIGLAATAGTARAQLRVTEFMADPTGTDAEREWFEIYNAGPAFASIAGYAAGDGTDPAGTSTGEAMGVFPTGAGLNPGQVIVVAVTANGFQSLYGFLPDYEFANALTGSNAARTDNPAVPNLVQKSGWGNSAAALGIANGGDDVGILTPESTAESFTFIDGSNHGTNTTFFSDPALLAGNQSYERANALTDTNSASDWIVRPSGEATPGTVTIPEPAGLVVLAVAAAGLLSRRRARAALR